MAMISFFAMKEGNFLSKRLKDLQIAKRKIEGLSVMVL
jgi:hypothetical protein